MLFNSPEFLFVFLPAVILGFLLLQRFGLHTAQVRFLVIVSLLFYGWWNWKLLALLIGSVVLNYAFASYLTQYRSRVVLAIGIAANLAALAWFKYAHFLADSLNHVANTSISFGEIALPLAISFFTFQQIAYLIDVHLGLTSERNVSRYALFVVFFPQLIAGPIVHHSEMLPQFKAGALRINVENLSVGLAIFALGLFKKVMIADSVGVYSDLVFSSAAHGTQITMLTAWFGVTSFALEIYFDFSGYSDMAIGLARIFGIRLPINFNSPYKAKSIIDFWQRWHITLSRFLRDYLYVPLGGNRKGEARRYTNIMIVMLIGGLWHGAAWTFVFWGALHGAFIVVNHFWRRLRAGFLLPGYSFGRPGVFCSRALTLIAVLFAWTYFRADSWESAHIIVSGLAGFNGFFLPESYEVLLGSNANLFQALGVTFGVEPDAEAYPTLERLLTVAVIFLATLLLPNSLEWLKNFKPVLQEIRVKTVFMSERFLWKPNAVTGLVTAVLLLASFTTFLTNDQNVFIYFQF